jgi:hypothetical protein
LVPANSCLSQQAAHAPVKPPQPSRGGFVRARRLPMVESIMRGPVRSCIVRSSEMLQL